MTGLGITAVGIAFIAAHLISGAGPAAETAGVSLILIGLIATLAEAWA